MNHRLINLLKIYTNMDCIKSSDFELLVIAQAGSVTYDQLLLAGLHGVTKDGARMYIKRLESNGLLTSHYISGDKKGKYFTLSQRGKKRIVAVFGSDLLERFSIDLDRRVPAHPLQIPHRVHTGDLFYCFLANPDLRELPVWQIEFAYQEKGDVSPGPRCDAMLKTSSMTYYIEQDNNTQGEKALTKKLAQYTASTCFAKDGIRKSSLVFTANCEIDEPLRGMDPFIIYLLLVKMVKIWKCLDENAYPNFGVLCSALEKRLHPSFDMVSQKERHLLKALPSKFQGIEQMQLEEIRELAKTCRHDKSREKEKNAAKDTLFNKRMRQFFIPLLSDERHATLKQRLRRGLQLSVMPNHRLRDFMPFCLQKEYRFSDFLFHILYSMGINETNLWEYHESYRIEDGKQGFLFFHTFLCAECEDLIIAEEISHRLDALERLSYFLSSDHPPLPVLFLLFVSSGDDAEYFLAEHSQQLRLAQNRNLSLCFLDESEALYLNPESQKAYFPSGSVWKPAKLDFDQFYGKLSLVERGA